MKNIKLKITGIKDNISKEKLINKLKEKKGIKNVEFNIPEKILSITYNKINKTKYPERLIKCYSNNIIRLESSLEEKDLL